MKSRIIFVLAMLVFSQHSFSLTEKNRTLSVNDVIRHRMHSVTHVNSGAHNMYMMYINGLEEGCNSLYLFADKDPYLFSAAISGLSSQKTNTIQVFYHIDDSTRGPWGDSTSCRLTSFTVVN